MKTFDTSWFARLALLKKLEIGSEIELDLKSNFFLSDLKLVPVRHESYDIQSCLYCYKNKNSMDFMNH
jgi:hypothetical protein